MTEDLVRHLGYPGIMLLLILGGLGLPVPEEAPIILAAVLSKKRTMWWPLALGACFVGVLVGDFIVYFLGYFYGEKVLSLPLTRKFLTRAREAQIKGYFHRHGFKILVLGRFAVGFRTAAYLTAGILRLPALKLLATDLCAATLSTLLMFGLGWQFAEWIEAGLKEAKHWIFAIVATTLLGWLLYRYYKDRRRAGRPIGPPVLMAPEDAPLPPDDLHAPPHARPPVVRERSGAVPVGSVAAPFDPPPVEEAEGTGTGSESARCLSPFPAPSPGAEGTGTGSESSRCPSPFPAPLLEAGGNRDRHLGYSEPVPIAPSTGPRHTPAETTEGPSASPPP